MSSIIFASSNMGKFQIAAAACGEHGLDLEQAKLDLDEIQGEDSEVIARDKGAKAFAVLQKPVVVTDDSWNFIGLGGFPGAYMHSMNTWLKPEDFLRLVAPLEDKRAVLTQYLIYSDGQQQKVFSMQTNATLLDEIRGTSSSPSQTIMSLEGDNGRSVAEVLAAGTDNARRGSARVWHQFAEWYVEQ